MPPLTRRLRLALPLLTFAFAAGRASAQAPNTLTLQEKTDGWVLLFDGRPAVFYAASRIDSPGESVLLRLRHA